jgi:hypothetical protein
MTSTTNVLQCSWADVVKGATTAPEIAQQESIVPQMTCDAPELSTMLEPGKRGSYACVCHGQVLSMLSNYGWLKSFSPIDHHSFWKHGGRIYVHSNDVIEGQLLAPGDIVSFYLYADNRGLGAEACHVEQRAIDVKRNVESEFDVSHTSLRPDAAEFVPLSEDSTQTSHPVASVFLRMSRTFESMYVNQYGQVAGVNSAYFYEDESSEDDVEAGDADQESCGEDSDHSSLDDCTVKANDQPSRQKECSTPTTRMRVAKKNAPWRKRNSSQDPWAELASDSTTVGGTSASESECPSLVMKRGLDLSTFRPPPGLSLPTERQPPPGVFLPPGLF